MDDWSIHPPPTPPSQHQVNKSFFDRLSRFPKATHDKANNNHNQTHEQECTSSLSLSEGRPISTDPDHQPPPDWLTMPYVLRTKYILARLPQHLSHRDPKALLPARLQIMYDIAQNQSPAQPTAHHTNKNSNELVNATATNHSPSIDSSSSSNHPYHPKPASATSSNKPPYHTKSSPLPPPKLSLVARAAWVADPKPFYPKSSLRPNQTSSSSLSVLLSLPIPRTNTSTKSPITHQSTANPTRAEYPQVLHPSRILNKLASPAPIDSAQHVKCHPPDPAPTPKPLDRRPRNIGTSEWFQHHPPDPGLQQKRPN